MLPKGVAFPMPKPFGGTAPVISFVPKGEGGEGNSITVQFVGEIGPITQYLEFIELLDNASENDEVIVMIDSPGGDVYTSQLLVERMESSRAKVITVASGLVASAATFIWLHGKEKRVDRWARFMFHSSLHGDWGKSLAIKENATELVNYMATILTDAQKQGVLQAAELARILKDKADVELSGSVVKIRLTNAAEGTEPAVVDPNAAPAAEPGAEPTSEPAANPEETPVVDPNAAPAEGGEAGAPAEDPAQLDPEAIFRDEDVEDPQINTPETQPAPGGEQTTSAPAPAQQPAAPEAKRCGGGKAQKKKCAKLYRRIDNADGTSTFEAVPGTEAPAEDPAQAPAEEPAAAPVEEPAAAPAAEPAAAPAVDPAETVQEPETPAPEGEEVVGAESFTVRWNASSDETVTNPAEAAKPKQGDEIVPNQDNKGGMKEEPGTTGEVNAPKKEESLFDIESIFRDECEDGSCDDPAAAPAPAEGGEGAPAVDPNAAPAPADDPAVAPAVDDPAAAPAVDDPAAAPAEGDPAGAPETDGVATPAAKCGGAKKAKGKPKAVGVGTPNDPVKVDPGTEQVTKPNEAEKGSDVEVAPAAPSNRYW